MKLNVLRSIVLTLAMMFCWVDIAISQGDPNPPSIRSNRGAWPLLRQWNMEEVKHFADRKSVV